MPNEVRGDRLPLSRCQISTSGELVAQPLPVAERLGDIGLRIVSDRHGAVAPSYLGRVQFDVTFWYVPFLQFLFFFFASLLLFCFL